ncbi:hypothetical protein [Chryseobacterium salviniae]|uniref:Lipoprotein n=1 Tax=Chryseobacterium salviniae TaxID=3101750 RepID=A0ABU6HSR6_9FLAO|nr:hypothetical protein [Chryseobacterium sp. T9W2-O]MEC3875938.1 hypothetical protein [Chryseobacterium sp. T9W2-O]
MKTYKILFLAALCLFLTACRTSRQVVKNTESKELTNTEIKTTYRDTVFYTQKAETSLKIPISEQLFKNSLNSFKPQVFTQKNGNAKATVKILKDTILVTAQCDSLALEAKIRREYFSRIQERQDLDNKYIEQTTKLNWQLMISLIVIAFIAGFVTRSLIKI